MQRNSIRETIPSLRASAGLLWLALALASGCSNSVAPQACEDLVRAVGDKAVECGFDRTVNENAFENNATGFQGCSAVSQVRDIDAFYDECIPFFEGLTCAQFDDPGLTVPAACSMQLRR